MEAHEAQAELQAATAIREKEAAAFCAKENELKEVIDLLQRVVAILEQDMVQIKTASNWAQAVAAMVQASGISSADANKLSSFVRNFRRETRMKRPVFRAENRGIVDKLKLALNGFLDKAEGQLHAARKQETIAKRNYEFQKQTLTHKMSYWETLPDGTTVWNDDTLWH